jgi:hypothetical protein
MTLPLSLTQKSAQIPLTPPLGTSIRRTEAEILLRRGSVALLLITAKYQQLLQQIVQDPNHRHLLVKSD